MAKKLSANAKADLTGAARLGAIVRLEGIQLVGLQFELGNVNLDSPWHVDTTPDVNYIQAEDLLLYHVVVSVTATAPVPEENDDPDEDGTVMVLEASYLMGYRLPETSDAIPEPLAGGFGRTSVLFTLYPYVRELVSSITSRAGLDPLTLDVIRSPVDLVGAVVDDDGELIPADEAEDV